MQKPGSLFLRDFRVLHYFWFDTPKKTKNPNPSPIGNRFGFFLFGGRGWIRTTEALSSRFTVCPHWPLGNTPLFCFHRAGVLPGDLFILPQALLFVNSFFKLFRSSAPGCRSGRQRAAGAIPRGAAGSAGLLAYFSTRRGVCQQGICFLGRDCCLLTKFLIPLVFFQAVLYNNDSGIRRGAAVLVFCLPRSGQTREGGILQTMDIIGQFTSLFSNFGNLTWQMLVMWIVGGLLIYLAIAKKMEPSLLLPMGFGAILVNLPLSGAITQGDTEGPLSVLFQAGMSNELFPLLLFIGIGAMIDFGPLLEKPWLMLFGAAAQFGIFFTVCLAGLFFDLNDAVSIGIIGAADGPTAIFVANTLGSQYLGAIMVAAYSYMALVPIVQPPVIRAITTKKERCIRMSYQKGSVTRTTRILFPIVVTVVAGLVAPASVALVGFLMFGNLLRECGVLNSLSETAQNALANLITILLGMTVASQMTADKFVRPDRVRHRGRRPVRQGAEPLPARRQEDQPHDRRGRHLGFPHERPCGQPDGPGGGQPELPADVLHQRQRLGPDRLGHRRRPAADPDGRLNQLNAIERACI